VISWIVEHPPRIMSVRNRHVVRREIPDRERLFDIIKKDILERLLEVIKYTF